MSKNRKGYIIIIFLTIVFFVTLFIALANSINEKQEMNAIEIKTDKEPIIERFPKLGRIEECYWAGDVISKDRDALGPSSYWMKGFVKLEKDEANKVENNFEWETVDSEWHPTIDIPKVGDINSQWYYSEEYNDYVLSYCYFGKFYYNFEENIIFFDIQR